MNISCVLNGESVNIVSMISDQVSGFIDIIYVDGSNNLKMKRTPQANTLATSATEILGGKIDGDLEIDGNITIGGGQTVNTTVVSAATYDLLPTDYILTVTYTVSGAVTSLTIPTEQVVKGRVVYVKDAGGNAGTNNITIDTEGAETIEDADTFVININYGAIGFYCDGNNWLILASY